MIPHTCTGPGCFGCKVKTLQLRPTTAFRPHFNYSVGRYVTTEHEFRETLRRRAEENTIATGTEHQYEMRDPGELRDVPYPEHDDILNLQAKRHAELC
jgi:hypothetical protein